MALNYVLGNILNDNLQRSANLSFNSSMLFLDVVDHRVGINTNTPGASLDVHGNVSVTGNITIGSINIPNIGNVTFANTYVTNVANPKNPQDAATKSYVDQKTATFANSNLLIANTTIYPNFSSADIILAPQGAGSLRVPNGNLLVIASVHASKFYGDGGYLSNITANNINFANVSSNIVPSQNVVYSLGNSTNQWKELWVSGNTIYMGGTAVSLVNGSLYVGNNQVVYDSPNGVTQVNQLDATGTITAGAFSGDGSGLTNLPVTYSNANVYAYLQTYTGDIHATAVVANYFVGNGALLSGMYGNSDVSGYLSSGLSTNIVTSANITAGHFIGDGSQLTNVVAGYYSNANVASYLPTNSANVSAAYFIGDGSQLTNLPVLDAYSNANVASYLPTNSANVSAAYFIGDGGKLSNIQYSNVVGRYTNSNVASYLPTNSANVSAAYFIGDGSQLTNLPVLDAYSNANVASYLPVYDGNILVDTIRANTVAVGSTFTQNFITTTASTAVAILCQFDIQQFNSFNYNVTAVDNTGHRCQVTKIIAATINNIVDYSEYGVVNIGTSLGSYEVTAFGGNLILLVHPTTTNLVEYSVSVTNYT